MTLIKRGFPLLLCSLILEALMTTAYAQDKHMSTSFYDYNFKDIDGKDLPASELKDKVVLVVNVASKCGLTPQYQALEILYQKYRDQGFEILAIPSNDFGSQEPDSCPIIKEFAENTYRISFRMTDKYSVSGDDAHPFYIWAGEHAGFIGRPKWNFHKYLIGKNGHFIDWFSSVTTPDAERIHEAIEKALNE